MRPMPAPTTSGPTAVRRLAMSQSAAAIPFSHSTHATSPICFSFKSRLHCDECTRWADDRLILSRLVRLSPLMSTVGWCTGR